MGRVWGHVWATGAGTTGAAGACSQQVVLERGVGLGGMCVHVCLCVFSCNSCVWNAMPYSNTVLHKSCWCHGMQVGMEAWARWAHRALWHNTQCGWRLHQTHHAPRGGAFEVRGCMGCDKSKTKLNQ